MYSKIVDYLQLGVVGLLIYCLLSCESVSHTVVQVAVGQKASLLCSVDVLGKIHVDWHDPYGTMLSSDLVVQTQDQRFTIRQPYIKEWVLDIANVRHTDAGNYSCRIGPVPEITRYVELAVTTPPEIMPGAVQDSYLINSTVTLTCKARGVPRPTITWHRLNEHHRFVDLKTEGETYIINSIDWSKAGVYECRASNGVPPIAQATLKVEVLFAPIVRLPYREVIQEEGRWTQFTCLIIANPTPSVYWMRNEERIKDSANLRVHLDNKSHGALYHLNLRLTLEELSASDYGQYRCYAENSFWKDQGVINLRGQDNRKPILINVPRDTLAEVGEDTLMNCSVVNLPKGYSVIWWYTSTSNETRKLFESQPFAKNARKMADSLSSSAVSDVVKYEVVGQYNLVIRKANYSDQGVYVCQITGHDNHSAILKVVASRDPSALCNDQKQPSMPMNTTTFIILAIVVFVLLVIVIVVVVLVYKLLLRRTSKNSVELSSKVSKLPE